MVVTYNHVNACILQIITLNWYYGPLVRCYENTMFLIDFAHNLVHDEYHAKLTEIRLYIHEFVTVGSYNRVK